MTTTTIPVGISDEERNAISYAIKIGMLKMLFEAELITERHYFKALNTLRAEAMVVAA